MATKKVRKWIKGRGWTNVVEPEMIFPPDATTKEMADYAASFRGPYKPYQRRCPVCHEWQRKWPVTREVYCPACYWRNKAKREKEYIEQHNKLPPKARIGKI